MSISVSALVGRLQSAYGVSEWWPRETSFEVAVGAILTQRTSWSNVQIAIGRLKAAGMMDASMLATCDDDTLHELLRPSGFYRQKSRYVRNLAVHLMDRYEGRLDSMGVRPVHELRGELLSLEGIGPETADAIILYALGLPSFVVDAYSFRLLDRLGIYSGRNYSHVKEVFERVTGPDSVKLSSVHAAIVTHCKEHCRSRPRCDGCPLSDVCPSEAHDKE